MSENNFILSVELLGQRIWVKQRCSRNGGFGKKCCAQGPGGSAKEISPQHGAVSFPDTIRRSVKKEKPFRRKTSGSPRSHD
jgi:hypothetical protein